MQCNPHLQKSISLSRAIFEGKAQLAQMEMSLKIEDTLDQPTTRKVFSGENSQIGYGVINILVKRFIDSFGFSTKLSDTQIEVLTVDTIEKFKYESLDDVILFFKMGRQGTLGTTKRGVDSNLIFGEWFPCYLEKKALKREEIYLKEKTKLNTLDMDLTSEDIKKIYEKEKEKINPFRNRVLNYIESITKDISREKLEELILEWENDEVKKPYVRDLKKKRLTIKT
jgi:hypothetical protein